MSWLTLFHKQTITYWAYSGIDSTGEPSFAAPTSLTGRWEGRQDLFVNAAGEEQRSAAMVFLGQDVKEGDWLYLGTSATTNPKNVSGAFEVKGFRKIPDLTASDFERIAYL